MTTSMVGVSNSSAKSSNSFHIHQYNSIDHFLDNAAHKGGAITGLVVLIAALVLSFNTLMETARDFGYGPFLSILWPLLIDGIILSQSLVVLRRSRLGFSTTFNWFLLAVFELASLFINAAAGWVLGADVIEMIIGATVHGLPPVALFLVSKSMSNDIKDNAILAKTTFDWSQAQAEVIRLQNEAQQLSTQNHKLATSVNDLKQQQQQPAEVSNGANEPSLVKANHAKQDQIIQRLEQLRGLQDGRPDLTQTEMAQRLNVSVSTIRRYLKMLKDQDQPEVTTSVSSPILEANGRHQVVAS